MSFCRTVELLNKGLETCNLLFNEYESTAQLQTDTLHRNLLAPSRGNGRQSQRQRRGTWGIGAWVGSMMVNSWLGHDAAIDCFIGELGTRTHTKPTIHTLTRMSY